MSNELDEKFVADDGISSVEEPATPAGGTIKKKKADVKKAVDPTADKISTPTPGMKEDAVDTESEEIVEEVITEDNSTKEEKTDEPAKSSSSSTAAAPAGPAFVFDPSAFEIPKRPPRQNQPITVMEYASPVEMFEKIEPTLRKVLINKEGTLGMDFSNDMVFPENWMAMHMDYLESTNQTDKLEKARRRLVGEA